MLPPLNSGPETEDKQEVMDCHADDEDNGVFVTLFKKNVSDHVVGYPWPWLEVHLPCGPILVYPHPLNRTSDRTGVSSLRDRTNDHSSPSPMDRRTPVKISLGCGSQPE